MEQAQPARQDPPNDYLSPEHLGVSHWLALPQLEVGSSSSWQDVSVRPAGSPEGFTVALYTNEILEEDFSERVGPHPRDLLPDEAGEEAALDVSRMAVYLRGPFSPAGALFYTEAVMVEAGIAAASLAEVAREEFYAGV
jgi:hypothetical protein